MTTLLSDNPVTISPPERPDPAPGITRGLFGALGDPAALGWFDARAAELRWPSWTAARSKFAGRGSCDAHLDPQGWSVFAMADSRTAQSIARLLSAHLVPAADGLNEPLSAAARRALFWDLMPGATFVAVHGPTETVCLARDVFGFVPLYYRNSGAALELSTNLQMLLRGGPRPAYCVDKLQELLTFGHHFGSRTVWNGIHVVAPGQVVVRNRTGSIQRHWFADAQVAFDPAERERLASRSTPQLIDEVRQLTEASVARATQNTQFVVLGGGGVDSSVLTAMAARAHPGLTTWSINHTDLPASEKDWVVPLSARLKVNAKFTDVHRENLVKGLVDMLASSGQPLVGPTFVGAAILRRQALRDGDSDLAFVNGELCDTLLGGLSSFYQLARWRRAARRLSRLPTRLVRALYAGACDDRTWILRRTLGMPDGDLARVGLGALERGELTEELAQILGDGQTQALADMLTWNEFRRVPSGLHHAFFERDEYLGGTMRYPFADADLLRFGFNLPWQFKFRSGKTKWLWRNLAADLVGGDVAYRPKSYFDAPLRRWLHRAPALLAGGFVEEAFGLSSSHFAGTLAASDAHFWPLVNIELWGRLHCQGADPADLLRDLL